MELKKEKNGNKLEIGMCGRLDTNAAPVVMKELEELLVAPCDELVIDMSECGYVASSGLRTILWAQKKMNGLGGSMTVKNVCDDVMSVFEMTGFVDILTIE